MEDALDQEVGNQGGAETQNPIWAKHAEAWEYVRPPLRPCLQDIELYQELVFQRLAGIAMPRVLLLGCTPELLLMDWPPDTRITCLEQSTAMAKKVYEGARIYVSEYVHTRLKIGNWLRLSDYFTAGSFDLVIGDGCYTQLSAPEYQVLGRQIEAVAAPGCAVVHRFFVQPKALWWSGEMSLAAELEALKTPYAYESFSELKLKLMVGLQQSFTEGVCLGEVYDVWARFTSHTPVVALKPQHYLARERDTIEHYRNSKKRYTFPGGTRADIARAVAPLTLAQLEVCGSGDLQNYCRMATLQVQAQYQRRPSILETGLDKLENTDADE